MNDWEGGGLPHWGPLWDLPVQNVRVTAGVRHAGAMRTGRIVDEGLAPFAVATGAPVDWSPSQPPVARDVGRALLGGPERFPLPATLAVNDVGEGAP